MLHDEEKKNDDAGAQPVKQHSEEYQRYFAQAAEPPTLGEFFSSVKLSQAQGADEEKKEVGAGVQAEEKKAEPRDPFQSMYSKLDDLFREDLDAQYGIVRDVVKDAKYPTGVAVIRDATAAKEVNDSSIDQFRIDANNALLRALGRLRSIDFVLEQKIKDDPDNAEIYSKLREKLKKDFSNLTKEVFNQAKQAKEESAQKYPKLLDKVNKKRIKKSYKESLDKLEKEFNTNTLCDVLHEANLDEGCSNQEDYEKLLFQYRNFSALIDPAKSWVTIAYDSVNKVIHRTRRDPITQKTEKQKSAIKKDMSDSTLFPPGGEETFQTQQQMGSQVANNYFADLAARDDRMMGAQARKSHLQGIKNAFLVRNELIFDVDQNDLESKMFKDAQTENTQSFACSATPVYVGKGEMSERLQESANENLEQVRQFIAEQERKEAKDVNLHVTSLVTDTSLSEHQDLMVKHTRAATEERKGDGFSNVPTNVHGSIAKSVKRSPLLDKEYVETPDPILPDRKKRYQNAEKVHTAMSEAGNNTYELLGCASGQDRTLTVIVASWLQKSKACYQAHFSKKHSDEQKFSTDGLEDAIARSRPGDVNAHMVGGSPGCKDDSHCKGLFSRTMDKALYLNSANTNKKNKVSEKGIKKILSKPSEIAINKYNKAYADLKKACDAQQPNSDLQKKGRAALRKIEAIRIGKTEIEENDPVLDNLEEARKEAITKGKINSQDLDILTRTLQEATAVVQGPGKDIKKYASHVSRLGMIAKNTREHFGWKHLLLVLGGAALVAAGIILAIPTGGVSLAATVIGANIAVSAAVTTGIGAAVAVTAFGTTSAFVSQKSKKEWQYQKLKEATTSLGEAGERADYVKVPFPPKFYAAYCNSLEKDKDHFFPSFGNMGVVGKPITYEKKHFEDDDILDLALKDLKRLHTWKTNEENSSFALKDFTDAEGLSRRMDNSHHLTLEQKQSAFNEYKTKFVEKANREDPNLKLEDEEAEMLLLIRSSMQGEPIQNGPFFIPFQLLKLQLEQLGIAGQGQASNVVLKRENGALTITCISDTTKGYSLKDGENNLFPGSDDRAPFRLYETCTLRKNDNNTWSLVRSPSNDLHVHPKALEHMLGQAKGKLNKGELTKTDLFYYIPLLIDKEFAKTFTAKIKENIATMPIKEIIFLNDLVANCHGPLAKQPAHIKKLSRTLKATVLKQARKELKSNSFSDDNIFHYAAVIKNKYFAERLERKIDSMSAENLILLQKFIAERYENNPPVHVEILSNKLQSAISQKVQEKQSSIIEEARGKVHKLLQAGQLDPDNHLELDNDGRFSVCVIAAADENFSLTLQNYVNSMSTTTLETLKSKLTEKYGDSADARSEPVNALLESIDQKLEPQQLSIVRPM